jgi:hypothetical protein
MARMTGRPSSLAAGSSGSTTLPLGVAAAAAVAAGEALPATVVVAAEGRPEGGRLPEDTVEDLATSWEDTPARQGKLRISHSLLVLLKLIFFQILGKAYGFSG